MYSLEGKNAVIIGASGGIGRVISRRLSEAGANLVLSARSEDKLQALRATLPADRTIIFPADASSPADMEKLFAHAHSTFGPVDLLVIAAGTWKQLGIDAEMSEAVSLAEHHFRSLFLPTFVAGFAVQKHMRREGHGLIVNISSHAAIRPHLSGNLTYGPMKAASRFFCHMLRDELKGTSVRVADIMPAIVNTEEAAELLNTEEKKAAAVQPESIAEWIIEHFDDPEIPAEKLFDSSVVL